MATIREVAEVRPIPNADSIEAIRVDGWWLVSKKGTFSPGDLCVFHEIDSLLPDREPYLFLKDKLRKSADGSVGRVLKTIRLRGQLSQGLALPLEECGFSLDDPSLQPVPGTDVSERLGVKLYEKELSLSMRCDIAGSFPYFIDKTNEERIQNFWDVAKESVGDRKLYVTEKLDGTSFTAFRKDGDLRICSRNCELKIDQPGSTPYTEVLGAYPFSCLGEGEVAQGEIYGNGINGNPLSINDVRFAMFNYQKIGGRRAGLQEMIEASVRLGLPTVPIMEVSMSMPESLEEILAMAEGKSAVNMDREREGIVVRTVDGAFSFKAISNKYLENE